MVLVDVVGGARYEFSDDRTQVRRLTLDSDGNIVVKEWTRLPKPAKIEVGKHIETQSLITPTVTDIKET